RASVLAGGRENGRACPSRYRRLRRVPVQRCKYRRPGRVLARQPPLRRFRARLDGERPPAQRVRYAIYSAGLPLREPRAVGVPGRDGGAAHVHRHRGSSFLGRVRSRFQGLKEKTMTTSAAPKTASDLARGAALIGAAQVARYHADGFTVVRGVFPAHRIAELDAEARRLYNRVDLIDTNNIRCRWQDHADTGECLFDCFDPVIDLSAACERVARDPRLLAIVGALYGEPACLFKDKLIFKAPGTLGYKLHQDYISWKSFPTSFLTVIVAIDHADARSGATEVFPGYHRRGCMSTEDGNYHQLPDDAVDPL